MNGRLLLLCFCLFFIGRPLSASNTTRPEDNDPEDESTAQESEAIGIIPEGGLTVSTRPITPAERVPEKKPYDQGLEELALAEDLLAKGRVEAASDVALQAYDDLKSVYIPRRNKAKRQKLLADRHRAATVYITASLAYIEESVKRAGGGPEAMAQGRARMADLRDVSVNYPELNKKVTRSLETLS